ncbi:MAG: hypothetical protein IKW09_03160 [Alphaproteobacteria bacterium]|nr:hypothetical protein [Alphaproteobacteria bacterium]
MKFLPRFLFNCSAMLLVSAAANAAGTYYNGAYQSPQRNYSQQSYTQRARTTSYSQQGVSAYNRNQYANAGYSSVRGNQQAASQSAQKRATTTGSQGASGNGFKLDAGISKQVAMWQFEMNTAGSKLHYDNIDWLVFDARGAYVFDAGNTKMQVNAGLQYGMQTGESNMIDEDLAGNGYEYGEYWSADGQTKIGTQWGHALSAGLSDGGNMFGFNVGVGLTDFLKWGRVKITPSIGWRYFKYELETGQNRGMVVVNGDYDASCVTLSDGSKQCWPLIAVYNGFGVGAVPDYPGYSYFDADGNKLIDIDGDGFLDGDAYYAAVEVGNWTYAEAEGTFYFEQPDVSHSYEVEWSGPYLAFDMLYDINQNNAVNAYLELGLPSYTAVGDQPYRYDWQHPKSVEDEGGIGSAFHLGLGANWTTAITDSVALSIGLTYDYYTVSDADATTYMDPTYWTDVQNAIFKVWEAAGKTQADALNPETGDETAIWISELAQNGWKDTAPSEIESFYKSMGIRVGINAKF